MCIGRQRGEEQGSKWGGLGKTNAPVSCPGPVTPALLQGIHVPSGVCDPQGMEGGRFRPAASQGTARIYTLSLSSWIFLSAAQCQGYKTRQGRISSTHRFDKWQLFQRRGCQNRDLGPICWILVVLIWGGRIGASSSC